DRRALGAADRGDRDPAAAGLRSDARDGARGRPRRDARGEDLTEHSRRSALLPSLAIVLSAVFWGSMWMPLRAGYGSGLGGAWVAWMTYGLPAIVVLPLILRDRGRGLMAGGWPLLWLGISTGVCNYLYAASVVYGDVARIVLLFYVNPVWSVL